MGVNLTQGGEGEGERQGNKVGVEVRWVQVKVLELL